MNSGSPITARLSLDIFTILFAALAILVVIALLWFISYAVENYKKSDNYTEKNKNRPTSRRNINDLSKRARLSKSEKELFTKICTAHPLPNINYALKNREIFDSYLKEAFVQLKKAKSENSKKDLFSLRVKMIKFFESSSVIKNTRVIPVGTTFNYTPSQGIHHILTLMDSNSSEMYLQLSDDMPEEDRPAILSKIKFIFVYKDSSPYEIEVRVIRYQPGKNNKTLMVSSHTDQIFSRTKRAYPRIDLFQDCVFSSVKAEKEGDKTEYKISEKIHEGQLLDISAGGCRISTKLAIKAEQYLHISTGVLDSPDKNSPIGFILRTTKTKNDEYILHIKFVKIADDVVNRINAVACGYDVF